MSYKRNEILFYRNRRRFRSLVRCSSFKGLIAQIKRNRRRSRRNTRTKSRERFSGLESSCRDKIGLTICFCSKLKQFNHSKIIHTPTSQNEEVSKISPYIQKLTSQPLPISISLLTPKQPNTKSNQARWHIGIPSPSQWASKLSNLSLHRLNNRSRNNSRLRH